MSIRTGGQVIVNPIGVVYLVIDDYCSPHDISMTPRATNGQVSGILKPIKHYFE